MATYCGKNCEECTWRQENGCAGCKLGPGTRYSGDCEIAQCAQERGHTGCDTCSYQNNCGKLAHKDTMPQYRQRKKEQAQQLQQRTDERVNAVRKWLWVLFWLVIPAEIAALMQDGPIDQWIPAAYIPGVILGAAVSVTYGAILLKLRNSAQGYGTAGICALIHCAVNMFTVLVLDSTQPWTLLLTIPAAIVSLVGERHEYMGHAYVLVNVDDELSDKWDNLWKWYSYCIVALLGSLVLVFLLPLVAALLAIASAVGMLVVRIVKLVYLFRTAEAMG